MFYRIKRMSDGLYSSGTMYPRFRKNGKMWNSLKNIKAHLAMFDNHWKPYANDTYVVEVYEMVLSDTVALDDFKK